MLFMYISPQQSVAYKNTNTKPHTDPKVHLDSGESITRNEEIVII